VIEAPQPLSVGVGGARLPVAEIQSRSEKALYNWREDDVRKPADFLSVDPPVCAGPFSDFQYLLLM